MVSLCKSHNIAGTNVVIVFQIWDLSASSRQTWKLCLKHLDQKLYCDNFALETFIHTENYLRLTGRRICHYLMERIIMALLNDS